MAVTTGQDGRRPLAGRFSRRVHWVLAASLALTFTFAEAANLQVNPILVEFAPGEQSQALWLSNTGTEPLKAQVRVSAWTQINGKDELAPSRDLLASPAILEVAAGERQLVRLIRPSPTPVPVEMAYRLTIDELPVDASKPQDSGVTFLLRYSVPVFVLAEGDTPLSPSRRTATSPVVGKPAQLSASLQPQGETSVLRIANPGRQRVRLSALAWEAADGKRTELTPGLLGYALAGQQMQWTIPLSPQLHARGGRLKARFNDDPNEQPLPLEAAGN